jgi:hypothetical protein
VIFVTSQNASSETSDLFFSLNISHFYSAKPQIQPGAPHMSAFDFAEAVKTKDDAAFMDFCNNNLSDIEEISSTYVPLLSDFKSNICYNLQMDPVVEQIKT